MADSAEFVLNMQVNLQSFYFISVFTYAKVDSSFADYINLALPHWDFEEKLHDEEKYTTAIFFRILIKLSYVPFNNTYNRGEIILLFLFFLKNSILCS